ncbi:hypothetical protein [Streptomyces lincolnensis]|uniref:hypothetical protein n=1 Tax=Streptomyces lincolnensis TaxID=1915 RepID=UPI0037D38F60
MSSIRVAKVLVDEGTSADPLDGLVACALGCAVAGDVFAGSRHTGCDWGPAPTKPAESRVAGSGPLPQTGTERGHLVDRALGERGGIGQRRRRS